MATHSLTSRAYIEPPAVIGDGIVFRPVAAHTNTRRIERTPRAPHWLLGRPTAINPLPLPGYLAQPPVKTRLTLGRAGATSATLNKPVVVAAMVLPGYLTQPPLRIRLTPGRAGVASSTLNRPTAVGARALPGYLAQPPLAITLARGRSGRPMTVLGQP